MFVGCSEIIISVIVRHEQHTGIIRACCVPGETYLVFQYLGGQKKLLSQGLLGGSVTQAGIVVYIYIYIYIIYIYWFTYWEGWVAATS